MPEKSLHQQTVDYAIQTIGNLSARMTALDLLILDLRFQLETAQFRIIELENTAEKINANGAGEMVQYE